MKLIDLRKIRKEKHLTQMQLSELTDYPQSFISQIENGHSSAPDEFLARLKKALGVENIKDYVLEDDPKILAKARGDYEKGVVSIDMDQIPKSMQVIVQQLISMLASRDARIERLETKIENLYDRFYGPRKYKARSAK